MASDLPSVAPFRARNEDSLLGTSRNRYFHHVLPVFKQELLEAAPRFLRGDWEPAPTRNLDDHGLEPRVLINHGLAHPGEEDSQAIILGDLVLQTDQVLDVASQLLVGCKE